MVSGKTPLTAENKYLIETLYTKDQAYNLVVMWHQLNARQKVRIISLFTECMSDLDPTVKGNEPKTGPIPKVKNRPV